MKVIKCAIDNCGEKFPGHVKGLVQIIEHWKEKHPGRVVTSGGTPVEEMSMEWAKK